MSSGRHTFKLSDLQRALRAIESTGVKAKVVLERDRMTVVPIAKGEEPPASNGKPFLNQEVGKR
jgi:hypothetical protein